MLALLAFGSAMAHGQSMPAAVVAVLPPGLHSDVVFDLYSPLASSEEMLGRLMSPLWNERMHDKIATSEQTLVEQSITLAQERFTVYIPKGDKPAGGYGLLVFILPWDKAKFPPRWLPEFDKHGVIAITASNSGNDRNVLERRIPLALSAYENIARRYTVDRSRVYIGGLSGGSRVALRIGTRVSRSLRWCAAECGQRPIRQ
ncbi:hypothetical protein ELE36_04515 [Pseudolysobacter antarcticus]|uniref:Phospholipase/carboxylesterase/thioesterase domain-containing protein n=1 Tax=Pseudolysobacter antarcticus TaxID=2511995 RepID=A0A411HGY8_9GAMM|nr:hypothetical protein [Pseudolysobacter antarcticus]QBB69694.1 hypothetical protein ELE36_04515 [Pseudolysobacter antarcticus]